MDINVFMDISLQLSIPLWISIWISLDFYGYPCIELLWILDPGSGSYCHRGVSVLRLGDERVNLRMERLKFRMGVNPFLPSASQAPSVCPADVPAPNMKFDGSLSNFPDPWLSP